MLYVGTTQEATAQLDALRCAFFEASKDCLVVNKLNRLEFSVLEDDAVKPILEVPIFSTISSMQSLHLPASPQPLGHATASLVILTTCLRLFAIVHDPNTLFSVKTVSSVSLAESFGRLAEKQDILVDPAKRCMVVHAYAGLVRIVPLSSQTSSVRRGSRTSNTAVEEADSSLLDLSHGYNVRLPVLNVASLALVASSTTDTPILAVVYTEHTGVRMLTTFAISLKDKDLSKGPVTAFTLADAGSELAIPVREAAAAGLLIAGEATLNWLSLEEHSGASSTASKGKSKAVGQVLVTCRLPVARITAWTWLGEDRVLLGDIYGKLFVASMRRGGDGNVVEILAQDVGDAASATAIVPLDATTVYLASRFDLELVDSFSSIAPVVDICVVSAQGQASKYAVTCSGAYKSGSLRVIRRGVGLTELAALETDGVQQIWSFAWPVSSTEQLLVLGFFDETRVFKLSASLDATTEAVQIDEVDLQPFTARGLTIFAGCIGSTLVRVTPEAVLYALDGVEKSWTTTSTGKITAAAAWANYLVLALDGGRLQLLTTEYGTLAGSSTVAFDHDIASLSLAETIMGMFAVVGLWSSQMVHLVQIPDLTVYASRKIASTFLIRSAALVNLDNAQYTLFVGLGNGSLASYSVDLAARTIPDSTEKIVALGRRPLLLTEISSDGVKALIAVSDRPIVIGKTRDRLNYSSLTLADVRSVANISHPALGNMIALVLRDGVQIGCIDTVQKVDVRTVPLDEDEPRRIVYDPVSRHFCVACSRRDIDRRTGERAITSVVRLVSEDSFESSSVFELERGEEAQSVALVETHGVRYYIVGTVKLESAAPEPTEGRLVVFTSSQEGVLRQVSSYRLGGCPYALVGMSDGMFASAVNSQVAVWSIDMDGGLAVKSTWSGAFIAYSVVKAANDSLVVGDALRSLTILRYTASPQPKLVEIAKDYRSRYMVGAGDLGSDSTGADRYIGAETDLNLFAVSRHPQQAAGHLANAATLQDAGAFHLGQLVTRFVKGSLGQWTGDDTKTGVVARLVYCTSAGTIGSIADLDAASSRILSNLERNMREFVKGVGGLEQEEYRAFKADKLKTPSAGFIDGDFVQSFLDLAENMQAQVMQGKSEHQRLGVEKAEIVRLLEEVARVH
ncbi:DNA damage-binding protein 1 [Rhodotorula toruloides]|uniref:DNA damage-binding protein 1 n=1 Tax=Rhodotorula toruloides TaxID=5286 RepID=A0A511KNC6_RHOTO|nr:DNA damage-binding protein 1 [Rhodotorula toruloides]